MEHHHRVGRLSSQKSIIVVLYDVSDLSNLYELQIFFHPEAVVHCRVGTQTPRLQLPLGLQWITNATS